ITDLDGNFKLENVEAGSKLVVSYIGFRSQEISIIGSKTDYQVLLEEDTQTLDEVVVVGFGTQKKVNLTGAVASVDKATLES
ncbi:carboxypeptidase-like regulatory domain-containing protein, partial [Enterococcus faecalis]|uniref:carboxypeptidase-like regulatory domain-containing protein n=2 Tax=Bacteria TaxID=2 RepID=UPI003D6ADDC4